MGRAFLLFPILFPRLFSEGKVTPVQVLYGDLRLEHGYVLVDICPCTLIQSQLPLRQCSLWYVCVCVCKMRQNEHSMRLYFKIKLEEM